MTLSTVASAGLCHASGFPFELQISSPLEHARSAAGEAPATFHGSCPISLLTKRVGKGPLSSVFHGSGAASLPRTASCFPSWNQQPALLANLLYQHQLPPPALQDVPVAAVPLGRGCCPRASHTLGGARGELGTPTLLGKWWPWSPSPPLGTGSDLLFVVTVWHAP